jgi:hypothetical protein
VAAEARAMMSSRAALAVLAAIAITFALLVVLEPHHAPEDHALAPGIDVASLHELVVNGVWLEKDASGWKRADAAAADPATIDAVLSALRGGRWHRRADRATAGTPHATVTAGGHTFGVGAPLEGTDQTWIARDSDAVLVDNWVATALAPSPIDLLGRHPFTHPPPLAAPYRVDPAFTLARAAAYAQLELKSLPPCGAGLEPVGAGCVESVQLANLRAEDARAPIDRRPVPFDPQRIELSYRATIDRTKRPQLDGNDADPDAVAALVAALAAPAEPAPLPSAKPSATLAVHGAHDDLVLDLYDHVLARRGEPSALAPSPDAWAAITRPPEAYQDKTRWLEDATTISAIAIDGKTFPRGATLGTWTGARDPALLDALATALAVLRADPAPAAPTQHTIELTITPPVGPAKKHELKLGAHCTAVADGTPIALPLAACTAAQAAL